MEEVERVMSLLDEAMEDFAFINKARVPDGEGGYEITWTRSDATFSANARLDNSMQARIGEKQGVTALYTITTRKAVTLEYHDVVFRLSDGKIFRVLSDGDDVKTPNSSTLDMRQVSAEEWVLPSD